jgi:hypothetical protein
MFLKWGLRSTNANKLKSHQWPTKKCIKNDVDLAFLFNIIDENFWENVNEI